MKKIIIIYTTINNKQQAIELAEQAVNAEVAACVNIMPNITSVYKWQDKIETSDEYVLIFKTAYNNKYKIMQWLKQNHSYTLPAILALPTETSNEFHTFIENNSQCLIT